MEGNVLMTPLHDKHIQNGAQMAPFMGCLLPSNYGDSAAEHHAVRTAAGLFDAAHRCEVRIFGADALRNLQNLLCSNLSTLQVGQVCRSLMLNMQGGVMDDVQVYHIDENEYRLALHTCNRAKDLRHISRQLFGDAAVAEAEGECRLALTGPQSAAIFARLCDTLPIRNAFAFTRVAGISCRVSRIGFAGEDSFSLCCAATDGERLYHALIETGAPAGLRPCGMESFVSLRLEAGHSLYGLEIDDAVSPMETGFRYLVQLNKREFIGRDALIAAGEPRRARIGLVLSEDVARPGCVVVHRDKQVGTVTSGGYCPYLDVSVAMALVETPYRDVGKTLRVERDDVLYEAKVVPLPFYSRES